MIVFEIEDSLILLFLNPKDNLILLHNVSKKSLSTNLVVNELYLINFIGLEHCGTYLLIKFPQYSL
jgi:hypothetical protein